MHFYRLISINMKDVAEKTQKPDVVRIPQLWSRYRITEHVPDDKTIHSLPPAYDFPA